VGVTCSTHGKSKEHGTAFSSREIKGRDNLRVIGIDGNVIEKLGLRMWIDFNWLSSG
jgi:hypothetical protein